MGWLKMFLVFSVLLGAGIDTEAQVLNEVEDLAQSGMQPCYKDRCLEDSIREIQKLGVAVSTLRDTVQQLQQEVHQLQETKDDYVTPRINFLVKLNSEKTVQTGTPVPFNWVQENHGNGYDPSTGKFTCPISGLYQINVHLMTISNRLEFKVRRNITTLADMILHPQNHHYYTDSASINVRCQRGEQVWVEGSFPQGGSTILHNVWNYFSGALIHESF